ncbi:peptide ABC transporter substrate-binding protein [Psittacicella gerlachiana]|uniref:Solute-binding protein family 5 domain-containing protein n=1 Tax=Psittacicella gerlachiana TaxID=2028574 RepID=A0A3A1YJV1_9GAMM|nr:peptide ABC transporter substrate-binding protein [Psittacicella gerlachiana]RIY37945.1 hypothetical protein CKF59_01080 [Psittacicella gerlachiana]
MFKKFSKLSLAILAFTGFTSFAQAVTLPPGVVLAKQQTLSFNLNTYPNTLDPTYMYYGVEFQTGRPVFDTLVRLDNQGNYIPAAASSWEQSEDGLTWIFHLRQGATWQDGVAVTADDFVYAWQRLTDPKTAAHYGDYLAVANLVNAREINEGKKDPSTLGVKALDAYTLEIKLTQPTAWLPEILGWLNTAPVRKDLIEKYGEAWTNPEHLVGNGPYKITQAVVNDHMVYQKWDDYWDAKNIYITEIRHEFINNPTMAYYKYLEGAYLVANIPNQFREKMRQERPHELTRISTLNTSWLTINPKYVPDARVRQALSLLTDRQTMTQKVIGSHTPTTTLVPLRIRDGQLATQAPYFEQPQAHNNAQAIALLQEAGYSAQNPLKLTFLTSTNPEDVKIFVALQGMWKQNSGNIVQLEQEALETKVWQQRYRSANFQLLIASWSADFDQASSFYNLFISNSPFNQGMYANPEYDRYVNLANKELDAQKRAQYYAQANSILQQDLPVIPLWHVQNQILKSPALGGYYTENFIRYYRDMYLVDVKASKPQLAKNENK